MSYKFSNILGKVIFQSGQFRFALVKIQDLSEDTYDNWSGQRDINQQHINELTESFLKSINETTYIKYGSSIPHIVLSNNGKKYIIDGQHRIQAYKKVCQEHQNAYETLVLYEQCKTENEIKEAFLRSNTQWYQSNNTLNAMYNHEEKEEKIVTKQDEWVKKLWNDKLKDYGGTKGMISRSSRPRKPHINENDFLELLQSLEKNGIIFTSFNKLKDAYERANVNIRQQSQEEYTNNYSKIWKKCLKYNCFLGLINQEEYLKIMERLNEKRKPVPGALKKECWRIKFSNSSNGNCEVCLKVIDALDFEAGHIISCYNGGEDTKENLVPVCKDCNRSMGTQNLYEYKKEHYPTKN